MAIVESLEMRTHLCCWSMEREIILMKTVIIIVVIFIVIVIFKTSF